MYTLCVIIYIPVVNAALYSQMQNTKLGQIQGLVHLYL